MLLIDKTFATYTQESSNDGEASEQGFVFENRSVTFRELVDTLRGLEPSQYPITGASWCWFMTAHEDCRNGESTEYSFHWSRKNKPHALKYWIKAIRAAGFEVKGE